MPTKKPRPTKEYLLLNYIENDKSKKEIASELNVTPRLITRVLNEYKIIKNRPNRADKVKHCICGKNFLARRYDQKYCSAKCMTSDPMKVGTFQKGVSSWNKGIPHKAETKLKLSFIHKGKPARNKGKIKKGRIPTKEELHEDYIINKLSREVIRKKYDISGQALTTALKTYNISLRGWSEARKIGIEKGRIKTWNKGLNISDERIRRSINNLNLARLEKSDESRRKLSASRKRLYAEGKIKIWNKGKTKYDDVRIAKSVEILRNLRIGKIPWNKKEVPEKEKLYYLYIVEKLSLEDISIIYNTNMNTVMRWLENYKIERRKSLYGRKEKIQCKDGHKVRSSLEKRVCDFLFKLDIPHIFEPKIHYYELKGTQKIKTPKIVPDFSVRTTDKKIYYIEIWGLIGVKAYEEKIKKKREFYDKLKKFGSELIEIYPGDDLKDKLGFLVGKASKSQTTL